MRKAPLKRWLTTETLDYGTYPLADLPPAGRPLGLARPARLLPPGLCGRA